jgi:hypothetical protein
MHGLEDDFSYFFVQRKCKNNVTRVDTIRTAALQIYTDKYIDTMNKFIENSNFSNESEIDEEPSEV